MSEGDRLHHLRRVAGVLQGRGRHFNFGCCDEFPAVLGIQMHSGVFLLAKALQWEMLRQYFFIPAVPGLCCLCSVIPWKASVSAALSLGKPSKHPQKATVGSWSEGVPSIPGSPSVFFFYDCKRNRGVENDGK